MQDLIVQIQSISVKPEDLILLTFSKEMDIDECNTCFKNIKEMFPNLKFLPNREDILKNITVLDVQIPMVMHYDYSSYIDQEGLPI